MLESRTILAKFPAFRQGSREIHACLRIFLSTQRQDRCINYPSFTNHQSSNDSFQVASVIDVEPPCSTRFALEVIHQTTERTVLVPASWTMIDLLLMRRTIEMLVEGSECREAFAAEITAIPISIPGCTRGDVFSLRIRIMVFDQFVREDVVAINLSAILVDLFTIDAAGATAGFEVKSHTGEVGELIGAPGALDVLANVDG